ncbi:MAG: precorrin-6A reductase [Coriobacteriia bacterium]|nr:precorrin-6A reductase [Coriobacteriia bacterium]
MPRYHKFSDLLWDLQELRIDTELLLVFGGTAEGRMLAQSGLPMVYSVVSEEALDGIDERPDLYVNIGPLDYNKVFSIVSHPRISAIIDASHPYAAEISASASTAAQSLSKYIVRLERSIEPTHQNEAYADLDIHEVSSAEEAAHLIEQDYKDSTIFLSTGSKHLNEYVDYGLLDALRVRVLDTEASIAAAREAGIQDSHIYRGKGPFSVEENLRDFSDASVLVTKMSGAQGGYQAKLEAAKRLGMSVIVIQPPKASFAHKTFFDVEETIAWAWTSMPKHQQKD